MWDKYNFITPAKVRVLLVPINDCTPSNFQRYLHLIQTNVGEVRLLDIRENNKLHYFNSVTSPQGRIFPEFITSSIDNELIFLHDFDPFRKTFIVLGVGPYGQDPSTALVELKKKYNTAIVHNVILFDTPEDKLNEQVPEVFFHNGTTSHLTALETIFCDISGNFLEKLDAYASAYNNITLRSPVSITDSHVLTKTINQAQKRLSSGSTSFKVTFNNSTTTSTTTPGSTLEKSKTHLKHLGRQRKLMGSFYLLAGKYHDAFQNFIESLTSLKKSDDFLWLASALEGVAVSIVLMQFIGTAYQLPNQTMNPVLQVSKIRGSIDTATVRKTSIDSNVSSPRNSINGSNGFGFNALTSAIPDFNNLPVQELLKIITSRVVYYFSMSTNDIENMVPDIVYVESILRRIKLLIGIHFSSSMEDIVKGTITPTPNGSFPKIEIIDEIDKIFLLQITDLNIVDQCRIYSALATMYADLGLMRKNAFILRLLISAILPHLSSGELPAQSIKEVLENVFVLYDICDEPESFSEAARFHGQSNWTSLQIQLLRLALKVAENLNDQELLLKLCTLLLTRYTHCLPTDDQIKLKNKVDLALKSNGGLSIPYWDPFLVRKVKFVNSKPRGNLIPMKETLNSNNSLQPFFDPYTKKESDKAFVPTLVKDDISQLKVTLQNPFAFEVEIHEITIVSEGAQIETIKSLIRPLESITSKPSSTMPNGNIVNNKLRGHPGKKSSSTTLVVHQGVSHTTSTNSASTFVLAPRSMESVMLSFKAISTGQVKITGFDVSIGNCQTQFFHIIDEEKFDHTIKLQKVNQKSKQTTSVLDKVVTNLQSQSVLGRVMTSLLSLSIIPPQPSLTLLEILASNGCLMLLEGEKHNVTVTLANHSAQSINYLTFSFWDSNIEFLNKKLTNPNLTAAEVHELEWKLLVFKPFRLLNKDVIGETINPGGVVELQCELTSRKFMNELKIILEYAHKSDTEQSFMKNLNIPLNVSVMPSIDVVGCEMLPAISILDNVPHSIGQALKCVKNVDDYCLLVLDLRNSWGERLECNLKYNEFELSEPMQAGKTQRFIIPIKRIEVDITKTIPSLRNKQFIKNYNISDEEEKHMKKLFWLRNSILENLVGSWKLGRRHGVIDLRPIRLTTKMANILSYENIQVHNTVLTDDDLQVDSIGKSYNLSTDQFYVLKTTIINHSKKPINGIVRQLPFPIHNTPTKSSSLRPQLSIDKKMLVNGTLQNKFPEIAPGDQLVLETSFVIIQNGEFEWGTVVDLFSDKIICREQLYITAN